MEGSDGGSGAEQKASVAALPPLYFAMASLRMCRSDDGTGVGLHSDSCFPPTELLMNHLQSIPPYFDFQP